MPSPPATVPTYAITSKGLSKQCVMRSITADQRALIVAESPQKLRQFCLDPKQALEIAAELIGGCPALVVAKNPHMINFARMVMSVQPKGEPEPDPLTELNKELAGGEDLVAAAQEILGAEVEQHC